MVAVDPVGPDVVPAGIGTDCRFVLDSIASVAGGRWTAEKPSTLPTSPS